MPVVTTALSVEGMHCRSCSMMIDMSVQEVDGVQDSVSDSSAGTTVVTYDDSKVSIDAIKAAIVEAGYEVVG